MDDADAFALVGREPRVARQKLRVADDAVERRAQLVAHRGEEGALGPAGRLRLIARRREIARALGDDAFEAEALALRAAEPPADKANHGAERDKHPSRPRQGSPMPRRRDRESEAQRLAFAPRTIGRDDLEHEGSALEVGEADFGMG